MNQQLSLIILLLVVVFSLFVFSRIKRKKNQTICQALKSTLKEANNEEKKESFAFVRSAIINIMAGVFSAILFLNINITFYNYDLESYQNITSQKDIINKYSMNENTMNELETIINSDQCFYKIKQYLSDGKKLSITEKRIFSEKCSYEKDLQEIISHPSIYLIGMIFFIIFVFNIIDDNTTKLSIIAKDSIIELSICFLAYAFILAVLFSSVNSYISATLIVILSILVTTVVKIIK